MVRPVRQHSRPRGGGSRQFRRRLFEWLEQEEQRLKKHDGHWMDIVRSLELESFILTKLTKPSVPVNLVCHKSASHHGGSQLAGGVFIFLCVIRRHFCGSELTAGGMFFSRNTMVRPVGPSSQGQTFFS